MHRGRTVLAMDCVLVGAELQGGRPLNSRPLSSTPCRLKVFFARSIPNVVTLFMTSPLERLCVETQSLHLVPLRDGEVPFIRWAYTASFCPITSGPQEV